MTCPVCQPPWSSRNDVVKVSSFYHEMSGLNVKFLHLLKIFRFFLSWKSCNILSWRHCCDVMVLYLILHKNPSIFFVANPETTSSGHPYHLMPGPVKIPKISRPRHPDAIGRMIETFLKLGKNWKTLSLRVFIFSNQWITVINQSGISPRSLTVRLWKITWPQ